MATKKRSNRRRSPHKSKKRSPRKNRRSPRKNRRSPRRRSNRGMTKEKCNSYLQGKIKKNMGEYKNGRYASRQQAIAVSYSQVKKKYPACSRYFSRK